MRACVRARARARACIRARAPHVSATVLVLPRNQMKVISENSLNCAHPGVISPLLLAASK